MIVQNTDGLYSVRCNFCNDLMSHDGMILAFHDIKSADAGVQVCDWFIDEGRHFCVSCVPAMQATHGEWLTPVMKFLFPMCDRTMVCFLILIMSLFILGAVFINIGMVLSSLVAYVALIQWHATRHERDGVINALIQTLHHDEESGS